VVQRGDGTGFALKAFGKLFVRLLYGDNTVQARVARLVDFPHAANASAKADLIGAEFVACGQSHLWVQPGLGNRKPTGGEFH
jgi:hypothetical protein